ncbi:PREDICTED: ubiquitin carboxyl-terminal hydrolase 17-like protein 6 [Chaetura pelagica]|uniref:ubiquitin carboxyl-terminal hydrolase 17-like protein 6 n=1 Tax=Chaetura pelagica TaxID=8897 RepID=UPI0005238C8B|nr:PREDICTED: ubiquitin carboxyl-terminal hydrolase 17-like protein 6 [Chaetura pelagica]
MDETLKDDIAVIATRMAPQGSMDWQERPSVGAGLENLGNTCFLNAVLQCLTYTPPLTIYLLSGEHSQYCLLPSSCVLCHMQKHVDYVLRPGVTSIVPVDIISVLSYIGQNRFKMDRQEDAHEFLRCTLEAMQLACLPETVLCLSCGRASERFEPFLDVLLDIKAAASITEALENFVKPEQLDARSGFRCRLCGQIAAATKTSTIHWAPEVLTLCLKRFEDSTGVKITKVVHYPSYLDLEPYMSQASEEPVLYKLYAVLVHRGHTCHSGHYYCYIKARDSLWYKMDDSSVTHSDINTALSQEAYLLFYLRLGMKALDIPTALNMVQ